MDQTVFEIFASEPFSLPPRDITADSRVKDLLSKLPRLDEAALNELGQQDAVCSVCYVPFTAILAEEECALAMESPAHPVEELGVTRLSAAWQCAHLFCRKDITKWIKEGHNSCPMCRKTLLDPSIKSAEPGDMRVLGASPELLRFYRQMGIDAVAGAGNDSDDDTEARPRPAASSFPSMFS